METSKILTADVLDLIFDGRNKDYGAYELRKSYNDRLRNSMLVMSGVVVMLLAGYFISHHQIKNAIAQQVTGVVILEGFKDKKQIEQPPLPPKLKTPKIEMKIFVIPKITRDEDVKENERPPEVATLEDAKIGDINQQGIKDDDITAPPSDHNGVAELPKDNMDYEKTFTKIEIESQYPGGMAAWYRYLNRNLTYPEEAVSAEVQGQVFVRFIVDKEGNVSDVEAISGPMELRDAAVRVIKKSGAWTPGIQNGRKVKSYKTQPVNFQLVNP